MQIVHRVRSSNAESVQIVGGRIAHTQCSFYSMYIQFCVRGFGNFPIIRSVLVPDVDQSQVRILDITGGFGKFVQVMRECVVYGLVICVYGMWIGVICMWYTKKNMCGFIIYVI